MITGFLHCTEVKEVNLRCSDISAKTQLNSFRSEIHPSSSRGRVVIEELETLLILHNKTRIEDLFEQKEDALHVILFS